MFFVRVDDPDCVTATCELCGAEWVPGPRGPGFVTVLRWHAIEHHGAPRCEHEIIDGPDGEPLRGRCQRQLAHPGSCMVWAAGDEWSMRTAPIRPEQRRVTTDKRRTG